MSNPTVAVLYHDDADGFGAAYACDLGFRNTDLTVVYIPVQYGKPVPDIPVSVNEMFIVDFSYDRKTILDLYTTYNGNLTVIDHHKTAEENLKGLNFCIFDGNKSGAVLTFETMFSTACPIPNILRYVQDRDLWKFELPHSKEVNAYIDTMPKTFDAWDKFDLNMAMICGEALINMQNGQIKSRFKDVTVVENFKGTGYTVPVVNATDNISELGNVLCKEYPESKFSVSYCDRANRIRSYSLRSIGDFDVSVVARLFGGGGHKNAAGFTELLNPY